MDGFAGGEAEDGPSIPAAAGQEDDDRPSRTIDFTEEAAAPLDRLFDKTRVLPHRLLSPKERAQLEAMLFTEFYRDLGRTEDDPAMRYQASLEVTWLEEWAEALMAGDGRLAESSADAVVPKDVDEARRLVKKAVLQRVDLHKPLSYIIGSQPFFGCDIRCRPPLLCPRPETEMWTCWFVKECLSRATTQTTTPLTVLDVCCGTGCIGVAIAKHVPRAYVTALDLLPDAVAMSNENARVNEVAPDRYRAILSDMFDCFGEAAGRDTRGEGALSHAQTTSASPGSHRQRTVEETELYTQAPRGEGAAPEATTRTDAFHSVVDLPTRPKTVIAAKHMHSFDAVVANPPYVLPDQYVSLPRRTTHWESKLALVGDDYRESRQYLYFQELCECGVQLLKPRRTRDPLLRSLPNLCVEVGLQARMVASIMERSGQFEDVEVHLDYAQQERWITANSCH